MQDRINTIRSVGGTLLFTGIGVFSCVYLVRDWQVSLPLVLYYAILLWNTYFSIRLFSQITPPRDVAQIVSDILLLLLYMLTAVSFWSVSRFLFFSLLLFIVATLKYASLLSIVQHPKLLKRKIRVDLLGVLAHALAFGGAVAGFPSLSAWSLAVVFIIANVILFSVYPLYQLDRA